MRIGGNAPVGEIVHVVPRIHRQIAPVGPDENRGGVVIVLGLEGVVEDEACDPEVAALSVPAFLAAGRLFLGVESLSDLRGGGLWAIGCAFDFTIKCIGWDVRDYSSKEP